MRYGHWIRNTSTPVPLFAVFLERIGTGMRYGHWIRNTLTPVPLFAVLLERIPQNENRNDAEKSLRFPVLRKLTLDSC